MGPTPWSRTTTSTAPAPAGEEKPTRAYTLVSDHLDQVVLGPGRSIDGVRLKAAYDRATSAWRRKAG